MRVPEEFKPIEQEELDDEARKEFEENQPGLAVEPQETEDENIVETEASADDVCPRPADQKNNP